MKYTVIKKFETPNLFQNPNQRVHMHYHERLNQPHVISWNVMDSVFTVQAPIVQNVKPNCHFAFN